MPGLSGRIGRYRTYSVRRITDTLSAINVTLTRRRGIVGGRAGLSFKSSALSAFNVRYACKHLSIARRRALKLGDVIPQLLFASTHLNSHIGVFGSDKKSPNGGAAMQWRSRSTLHRPPCLPRGNHKRLASTEADFSAATRPRAMRTSCRIAPWSNCQTVRARTSLWLIRPSGVFRSRPRLKS